MRDYVVEGNTVIIGENYTKQNEEIGEKKLTFLVIKYNAIGGHNLCANKNSNSVYLFTLH